MRSRTSPLAVLALCGGLVGSLSCAPGEEGGMAEEEMSLDTAAIAGEAEGQREGRQQLPDTTAEALWSYLQQVDYRNNWQMWPGKGELYEGQEPHGMLLTTYVNDAALRAVSGTAGSMPSGAIVVKENYMPDSTLAATTVMYKSSGYDAQHNDWFWLKRLADGTVEVSGRGQGCISCHGGQNTNDYIFTSSLSGAQ